MAQAYLTHPFFSPQYAAGAGDALDDDLMKSYAPQVISLLDKWRVPVLLYQVSHYLHLEESLRFS